MKCRNCGITIILVNDYSRYGENMGMTGRDVVRKKWVHGVRLNRDICYTATPKESDLIQHILNEYESTDTVVD